jgi:hypothetical protein
VFQHKSQQAVTQTTLRVSLKQFTAGCLQKLPILDSGRTHLFTGSTSQATIDVSFKRRRGVCQPAFADGAHEVEPAAWAIIFVAGDYISRTRFQAQAAVNASKEFFFFAGDRTGEQRFHQM